MDQWLYYPPKGETSHQALQALQHVKTVWEHSNALQTIQTIVPNTNAASKELKNKILPHLRGDDISLLIKNDQLILAYGTRLLKKKKERRSRKSICSKMRDLATLLILIRKNDTTVETLTDALDPEKYDVFITSVKQMCGFNENTGQVRVPSIPARILPAIIGCTDILYTQCIMSSETTAFKELYKRKLDDFKQLVTINWQWEISSNAEKTKKRRHMTKENVLPLDEDIKTVMEMIAKLEVKYGRKLKIDCNVINYESLCTVTIAHIIMLDRKRAGDVAEAELVFYINRRNEDISEELLKKLTPAQKQSMKDLDVFQIPGKRTRSVPILLTKTMRENIDLIIACRDDLKIPQNNPLLFARPLTDEPFDGGKCLNKIKDLCNLKRPEMLTSTGMRHHIATMSQLHSKQNGQYTEQLAGFLGHDINVHTKNYRLPLQVLQKAVVGSQLMKYESKQNKSASQIFNDKKQSDRRDHPRLENSEETIKLNVKNTQKDSQYTKKNYKEESEQNAKEIPQRENVKEDSDYMQEEDPNISNFKQNVVEINLHERYAKNCNTIKTRSKGTNFNQVKPKVKSQNVKENDRDELQENTQKESGEEIENSDELIKSDMESIEENNQYTRENDKKESEENDKDTPENLFLKENSNYVPEENHDNVIEIKTHDNNETNSNANTRYKRKNVSQTSQTQNKAKNLKKVKKSKKARLDIRKSSSSENIRNDEECIKVPDKRPLDDSDSEKEIPIRRKKKTHRFWTDKEIKVVKSYFKDYIKRKKNPGKAKCMEVLKKEPILQTRTWMQLNTYINNIYKNK